MTARLGVLYAEAMNCIIIEDEEAGRIHLRELIKEIRGLRLIGEAADCATGKTLIQEHPEADLLLLDIELPDGTAFDLIEQLDNPPKIIFITNHEAYALRAFEVNALDYIQKPLTRARLESALERLDTPPQIIPEPATELTDDDLILLTSSNRKYFTRVRDVISIESDENYTRITRTDGKQFMQKKTLAAWKSQLPANLFRQAGRSLIVNLNAIDRIEGGALWFKGATAPLTLSLAAMKKLQQMIRSV